MKRLTLMAFALLFSALALGQQQSADSAAAVVDRYLSLMNVEGYSEDSMLVMTTAVTVYGSNDTLWMRRWFAPPKMHRVELWYHDTLTEGLTSNGDDRYRRYDATKKRWTDIEEREFSTSLTGYDFRGPLYLWRWRGAQLTWGGMADVEGAPLQVVKVSCPGMYDRLYMFEPGSGLLALVVETQNYDPEHAPAKEAHIDFKSYHEYLPVGTHLVPSVESFMRDGALTILTTTATLEGVDRSIFYRK